MRQTAPRLAIRPITDRPFLEEMLRLRWSGGSIMVRGQVLVPADVDAIAAYDGDALAGVATFRLDGEVLYLLTMNNITDRRGVGVALLDAMLALGRHKGAALIRAIITNDNLGALRFYQRRGFRIIAVYPGIVDAIRAMNPNVPLVGQHGIAMRDEIELEREL